MTQREDDDDLLAGEYVLGLLEGPERSAVEARLSADAAFGERVDAWMSRLAPLAGAAEEPPASVWQGIAARLSVNDDEASARAGAAVRRWRAAAIGASAVAASLALVLVTRPAPDVPQATAAQPVLVALLRDEGAGTAVTISVEQAGGQLLVTPVRLAPGAHSPELWIIPADGTPRSLGVIRAAAPSRVVVPRSHQAHIHQGATFAITLEPAGGSPTGTPTGQTTASGKITSI